jgi:methylglutaconyl-CoA hydratase
LSTGENHVRAARGANGVVTLTLDRPARKNAFDEALITALHDHLDHLARDQDLRALVLTGAGSAFSAGADLDWMRRAADFGPAENRADARALEAMLSALDGFPRPTVARVNGAAIGGGVGLVAACDIAIASEHAVFAMSEVRLGLMPAVVAPFVRRAMGERACRRLFLSAERFDAVSAKALGLVHEVVADEALDGAVAAMLAALLQGGPEALRATKALLIELRRASADECADRTTRAIAERRASAEGREGVAAFLEKRRPRWTS